MIRKALLAGVSIIAVLALAACGGPHQGVVRDKDYEPGHYYPTQVCTSYTKEGACRFYTTQQNWQGPRWRLDIYNGDEHGWQSVSKGIYDSVKIGDHVDLDK